MANDLKWGQSLLKCRSFSRPDIIDAPRPIVGWEQVGCLFLIGWHHQVFLFLLLYLLAREACYWSWRKEDIFDQFSFFEIQTSSHWWRDGTEHTNSAIPNRSFLQFTIYNFKGFENFLWCDPVWIDQNDISWILWYLCWCFIDNSLILFVTILILSSENNVTLDDLDDRNAILNLMIFCLC